MISSSLPLTAILFVVLAVLGIVAQVRHNRDFTVNMYNRYESEAVRY